jgi:hypothetical protein
MLFFNNFYSSDLSSFSATAAMIATGKPLSRTALLFRTERVTRPFEVLRTLMDRSEFRRSSLLEKLNTELIRHAYQFHSQQQGTVVGTEAAPFLDNRPEDHIHVLCSKLHRLFYAQVDIKRVWACLNELIKREFGPEAFGSDGALGIG